MATKSKSKSKAPAVVETPAADFTTDGPALTTVDVADVGPADRPEDEHILLTGESWVVLGKYKDEVPDWAIGQPAAVLAFPVSVKLEKGTNRVLYEYTDPKALITVRERSQGVTFQVPLDSCTKVSVVGGRNNVANFG
jgi:hypothetical protein